MPGRLLLSVPVGLLLAATVTACPGPAGEPRADADDPLTPGAVARLGTAGLRNGGQVGCLAFTADGKQLAGAGGDGTLRFWEVATGKEARVLDCGAAVTRVAFSPDGKRFATGSTEGAVTVWDAATVRELHRLQQGDWAESLAFSADGKVFASGDHQGKVRVWDAAAGKELHALAGHELWVRALAFSPDGKTLASAGLDLTVRGWDVAAGKEHDRLALGGNGATAVAFLPEGSTLLVGDQDGRVRFLEWPSKKELRQLSLPRPGHACLALSADGKTLVTSTAGEKAVRVWDAAAGKELRTLGELATPAHHLALAPDGKTAATAGFSDSRVQLWDVATGQERFPTPGHRAALSAVFVAAGGQEPARIGRFLSTSAGQGVTTQERERGAGLMGPEEFRDLLARVRGGDADAASALVRHFEPAIRRHVRLQLTDPRLRRVLDSTDVCQSVLAGFFVRAAAGQFDLDTPQQLFGLLTTMAANKVLNHARNHQAECRDQRRVEGGAAVGRVPAPAADPARLAAGRELLREVSLRLTLDERALLEQRTAGRPWAELAAERGASAEALRKQYARALDRVANELGLGDESHE